MIKVSKKKIERDFFIIRKAGEKCVAGRSWRRKDE